MQSITKEAVDRVVQKIFNDKYNKKTINLNELIASLVEEFDSEKILNQDQKNKLGDIVFFNPEVLKQLEKSDQELEVEGISNYEEYLKFKNEVFNEK